jgi:hypothetical protein
MVHIFQINASKIALIITILLVSGCATFDNTAPTPTPLGAGVDSPQKELLIGKWQIDHGRVGHAIFDFKDDGTLSIETVDSGEIYAMSYIFVDEGTIAISGFDDFNGTADIGISANSMDFTIIFADSVFGEIYPSFERVNP